MIALRHAVLTRPVQAAVALLLGTFALALMALTRAVRLEPLPVADPGASLAVATPQGNPRTPNELIEEAVAAAPFTASREPGGAVREQEAAQVPDAPQLQLIGTVVGADGDSFVLVVAGQEGTKVVRIGGSIAGHRLQSIGQASAVFTRISDGRRVELRVPRSR